MDPIVFIHKRYSKKIPDYIDSKMMIQLVFLVVSFCCGLWFCDIDLIPRSLQNLKNPTTSAGILFSYGFSKSHQVDQDGFSSMWPSNSLAASL